MNEIEQSWELNCKRCNVFKKNYCTAKNINVYKDDYCILLKKIDNSNNLQCSNCENFASYYCTHIQTKINTFWTCQNANLRYS